MYRLLFCLWGVLCPSLILAQGEAALGSLVEEVRDEQLKVEFPFKILTIQDVTAKQPEVGLAPTDGASSKPGSVHAFLKSLRPAARKGALPATRWEHMKGHQDWTRTALAALSSHGAPLVEMVPADIQNWCAAYPQADAADRRAFWVGFLSALAKHESTYKPWAVGGGGKWYGLLQILPGTARGYNCKARSGAALKDGGANLSCAIRIMAQTVPRDGVIHGYKNRKGRGVTADWGPMHSAAKRRDMAGWLQAQNYCKPLAATRPAVRPQRGSDH